MIKDARRKIGLSQSQLGQRLQLSQSYISKLENRKITNISINLIVSISKVLNLCPISVFSFFITSETKCKFK